jgi:predicted signal transduction protein with EAL and GGDEF domain
MEMLREPMQIGDHIVQVGASIGVAVFPDDAADIESLCIAADLRMYDTKNESRDATIERLPVKSERAPEARGGESAGFKMAAHAPKV